MTKILVPPAAALLAASPACATPTTIGSVRLRMLLLAATLAIAAPDAAAQEAPRCRFGTASRAIAVGDKADGRLAGARCRGAAEADGGNSDWVHDGSLYTFAVTEPTAVEISVTTDRFQPGVALFRGDGTGIAGAETSSLFGETDGRKATAAVPVTLQPGAYFVGVLDADYTERTGMPYEIRVRRLAAKAAAGQGGLCDPATDAARRPPLAFGGKPLELELGVADCFRYSTYHQHFRLRLETPRLVTIRAESRAFDPSVEVIAAATGRYLQDDEDLDESDEGIRAELPAGEYLVVIASDNLGAWDGGKYRLHVTAGEPIADVAAVAGCEENEKYVGRLQDPWTPLRLRATRQHCRAATAAGAERFGDAVAAYEAVLRENPGDRIALDQLMLLHARAGRWTEARPLLERALADEPFRKGFRPALAMVLDTIAAELPVSERKRREALAAEAAKLRIPDAWGQFMEVRVTEQFGRGSYYLIVAVTPTKTLGGYWDLEFDFLDPAGKVVGTRTLEMKDLEVGKERKYTVSFGEGAVSYRYRKGRRP